MFSLITIFACTPTDPTETLFAVGDSFLDFYADEEQSIPHVSGETLGMRVQNNSISGALFTGDNGIGTQFEEAAWPWVLINGGGNDANELCGCEMTCVEGVLNEIASSDGTSGELVSIMDSAIANGSQVAVALYMPVHPEAGEDFANCGPALEAMTTRYQSIVDARPEAILVNASDIISVDGTPEAYHEDKIHPSIEGSRMIGEYIAQQIESAN